MTHFSGYSTALNIAILTTGVTLGPPADGQYPGVYCSVYLANSLTLASIADRLTGRPKTNPFLVDANGFYEFDGADARYTVVFSATLPTSTAPREVQVPSFPFAALPTPASPGRLARLTDRGAGLWMDSGAAWLSVTGTPCVDVTAFGAVGDGVTDDAPAIQAAIDSLGAQGGVVYFPHTSACYRVNTTLRIGKGVRLIGSGWYDAIIANVAGGPNVVITTVSGGGGGMEIAHLQIICQNVGDIALHIKGVDRVRVHDSILYSTVPNATLLQLDVNGVPGAYTHRIAGNIFQFSAGHASQAAIRLVGGVTSSVFRENYILADHAVVEVAGAASHGANVYTANLFTSITAGPTGTGIQIANGGAASCSDVIEDNYFENFLVGINFPNGSLTMMVENNHWDNVTTHIVDGSASSASGSLIDLETRQIALGSTVGYGPGSYATQGDSATDALGFRTFNVHAGGRGWSLLNGQSAADEFSVRDDTAGTSLTKWNATGISHTKRHREAMGATVASANELTLGVDGNLFHISGTTTINAITTANWQAGAEVMLIFDSTPTVKHNTAGGAGTAKLLLAGGIDFGATANDTLTLRYDGTSWFEKCRTVI